MKKRKTARIMSLFLALTMTSLLAAGCGQKSTGKPYGNVRCQQ